MPSTVLRKSRFLHVPKTGGNWVSLAFEKMGLLTFANLTLPHVNLRDCPGDGMFTFCGVRDPVEWHESYWRFKMVFGWRIQENKFDAAVGAGTFERFLELVLDNKPEYYSWLLKNFAGESGDGVDIMLRTSHLKGDLIRALFTAGEKFDFAVLDEIPPHNVSKWPREAVSGELLTRLREKNQLASKLVKKASRQQKLAEKRMRAMR